ncbi:MAG: type IV pilin protein [Spongiibacteraceae bacterium]|jgi:type IV pilus assembly protein PilE|nr:type IV pilin protein [Spongiibacteraceae bacterium]
MMTLKSTGQRGFSLIELMIALAIVALLAAVAIPSYQNQVTKTRRGDAIAALEKAAARLEQHYFQFNQYSDDERDIGGSADNTPVPSPEGWYGVSIAFVGGDTQTYTLTASPVAGGPQADDSRCTSFTLNYLGQRGATPSANTDLCWNR